MSVYEPRKQDYKSKLLAEVGLDEQIVQAFGDKVHMVKPGTGPNCRHRLLMHDGGWVEVNAESRKLVTWGPHGLAEDLAARLVEVYNYEVQRLEKSAAARNPSVRSRRPRPLDEEQAKSLADGWRRRGFDDVTESEFGCWIALDDGTRLYDTGAHVDIHGPATDDAIAALVSKADTDWDQGLRLTGTWSPADRARVWLECQRRDVNLADYTPSPALLARWQAEESAGRSSATALRPGAGRATASVSPVTPDPGEPEPAQPRLSAYEKIDQAIETAVAELATLHAGWSEAARDTEKLEKVRREEQRLLDQKRMLLLARQIAADNPALTAKEAFRLAEKRQRAGLLVDADADYRGPR